MAARWLAALSFVLASAFALAASGQPSTQPRVSLTWSAPSECPRSEAVVAEVDRILGEKGARPEAPLAVSATVTGDASGYRVEVRAGERSRSLRGKTCAAVADATALAIALAIDPTATPPPRDPAPATAPRPATETGTAPATEAGTAPAPGTAPATGTAPVPVPAPATPRRVVEPTKPPPGLAVPSLSFRFQAWAGGEVGALPSATGIFGGQAGIVLADFRLMLGGEALLPQSRTLATGTATAHLAAATIDVGYTFHRGPFELGPLVGFEIGSLSASSSDVTSPSSKGELWDAARIGGFAAWFPISRLGITTRVEAAIPFSRPTFFIQDNGHRETAHRASGASGRLVGGIELRL